MPQVAKMELLNIRSLWTHLLSIDADDEWSAEERELTFHRLVWDVAAWPPDVFCLVAAIVKSFGGYTWLTFDDRAEFREEVRREGLAWQREAALTQALRDLPPSEVFSRVTVEDFPQMVTSVGELLTFWGYELSVSDFIARPGLQRRLIRLLVRADHACEGLGLPVSSDSDGYLLTARYWADLYLEPGKFGSTLCRLISPTKARVLPKTHTPPSGRTLRSLSHHVCYVEPDEGRPHWYTVPARLQSKNRLNMLLVPYPPTVSSSCFRDHGEQSENHSHFSFHPPDTCGAAARHICELVARAEHMGAPVNVVVLPETALCAADYRLLRSYLVAHSITLISGLGGATQEGELENRLSLDVPLSASHAVHLRQRKHHPWRIHGDQIRQYELANELDPSRIYWEKLRIGDRNTYFVALHPRIVATVLVCEDLAQYEPVGRLIRAVGPNLVVALLLDGPQIGGRWPERYAAVLSDDPGSSVLSLTCSGMSTRSKFKPPGIDRSRVVALWKDPNGKREIELEPGNSAILLTLTIEEQREWTADLRSRTAVSLHLAQSLQIASDDPGGPMNNSWFDECMKRPPVQIIAPVEASALARLARLQAHGAPQDWAEQYGDIAARLGVEGKKIARHMLHEGSEPPYPPEGDAMGPEEMRQAGALSRCGERWREVPEGYQQERSTAKEIKRWAEALRAWK